VEKSSIAFRTISEVAVELDVPKHVLRFWEGKFSQLRPMKRGGGRRYYRPEDVDLLRGIRWLLYDDGYTIKGVQRILRDSGVRYVKQCWRDDLPVQAGKAKLDIPNLAGEAADEARRTSLARRSRAPASRAATQKQMDAISFSPEQKLVLSSLLRDLEECRDILVNAAQDRRTHS